jgi:phage regulator Rha-like protein
MSNIIPSGFDQAVSRRDGAAAMSSLQIADLVEKRHDNVKRTIETLAGQGVIEFPQSEEIPTATKPVSVYVFSGERGKRDSIVVVAQLSPEFTARLVDRWQELERRAAAPVIPQTLPDALRLAADLAEGKERAESALALAAPKAAALDIIAYSEGSFTITTSAKTLQVRPKFLFSWLRNNGWIYRRGDDLHGYQDKVQAGLLIHKVTLLSRADTSDKVVEQVRVTPKGLTRLAMALEVVA